MSDNDKNPANISQRIGPGIPGVQQPPTPSADQIKRVMEAQAKQRQIDAAEAQRRAAEFAKNAQSGQSAVQGMALPPRTHIPSNIAEQMPPQMHESTQVVEQINDVQAMNKKNTTSQSNQFAKYSTPEPEEKIKIPWYPIRSNGVDVELEDSIITCIPKEGIDGENDAQGRVILALFSEILFLRQLIQEISQSSGPNDDLSKRVWNLERVLFEQRQDLSQKARGVRQQVEAMQEAGFSAEKIVESISDQSNNEPSQNQEGNDE